MNIQDLQKQAHKAALEKGWYDGPEGTVGGYIALAHSELSEAFEEYRNGHPLTSIYFKEGSIKPEGFPVELADVFIRLADTAENYGIDLTEAIHLKMAYNVTREYRHGGLLI